ncbi:protein ORF-J [Elephant endotheliotropic herpesvirus 6]|nr:protein U45.7 [Elephant endotheliotropic herpesvirus 6]UEH20624.1 protein ORF-J [Elephant endotheliotropic herpesvirus 6]
MVRVLKIFKKINKECCNVEDDEYIDIDASTNSVVPTSCDYMTKATGGLPSLDSDTTHNKNCLCECPGSSVPPESIDRTIKSDFTNTNFKDKKRRVKDDKKHQLHKKCLRDINVNDNKKVVKHGKKLCSRYLKLYVIAATVTCTCVLSALLIFKYVSPLFQNETLA